MEKSIEERINEIREMPTWIQQIQALRKIHEPEAINEISRIADEMEETLGKDKMWIVLRKRMGVEELTDAIYTIASWGGWYR